MATRIEICGGIAAGKTTLANLIARSSWSPIYEDFEAVPFWRAFYAEPGAHAFETEVSFLLQHYHQVKVGRASQASLVCDYSFLMDRAYADLGLRGTQHSAFMSVYQEVEFEVGAPDLLVYLSCPTGTELSRIRSRGRATEANIRDEFVRDLNACVEYLVKRERRCPVLVIDSECLDFTEQGMAGPNVLARVQQAVVAAEFGVPE